MPVRDFRERIPDRGPMILYRITLAVAVAICLVLAVSASAKEPRSASVKREFKLTHPCPATGLRTCGGPDVPSNLQWQTVPDAKDRWETKGSAR
jgi:hypothetical protein